jgi:energy-coupling factor transport system ATP-binding protein
VVEDEVLFGLENFGFPKSEIEGRVARALADMGISDLRDRTIESLSGGQKQKVAVAAICAMEPAVLVLDEPTAELDPASSKGVFDLLARYAHAHGTTVVVVEQKIALLSAYADRILIMKDGSVFLDGAPADVLEHADELRACGVNCPRATSLGRRLRVRGLYAGPACRTVDDAVAAVEEAIA